MQENNTYFLLTSYFILMDDFCRSRVGADGFKSTSEKCYISPIALKIVLTCVSCSKGYYLKFLANVARSDAEI